MRAQTVYIQYIYNSMSIITCILFVIFYIQSSILIMSFARSGRCVNIFILQEFTRTIDGLEHLVALQILLLGRFVGMQCYNVTRSAKINRVHKNWILIYNFSSKEDNIITVRVTIPMSNCELPHSEWILLSLQFIANAHELSMLSCKNKFLL